MFRQAWLASLAIIAAVLLSGCVAQPVPLDDLFPSRVGDYLRSNGPNADPSIPDLNAATYQGIDGAVLLRIKYVGEGQSDRAISGVPLSATNVGEDPALGQRKGKFFNYGGQFHAAWGNGDWVFVISAPTEAARIAFLAGYGF
jgi:hypothetical protein